MFGFFFLLVYIYIYILKKCRKSLKLLKIWVCRVEHMKLILRANLIQDFLCPSSTAVPQLVEQPLQTPDFHPLEAAEGTQPSHGAVVGLQVLYCCHQEIGFLLLSSFWCHVSFGRFCSGNSLILQKCFSFLCDARAEPCCSPWDVAALQELQKM